MTATNRDHDGHSNDVRCECKLFRLYTCMTNKEMCNVLYKHASDMKIVNIASL